MTRRIHCSECQDYLGEIRDAKLKKGMVHLCSKCESARKLLKHASGIKNKNSASGNVFTDMFGGILNPKE